MMNIPNQAIPVYDIGRPGGAQPPNLRLTSYSRATFPLESLTNGNVPPSDSPNLCRRSTLSVLAPTVTVFANANCPWSFTNSLVSRVQPRVNA